MKNKYILLLMLVLTSCVDSLDDYNVDQKRPSTAPPPTLFTNAIKNLADAMTTPNVNNNNFRLYVQQWATTTYLQEPRYDMTSRIIPQNLWQSLYKDVLADLREARRLTNLDPLLDANVKATRLAQLEIMEVFSWSLLVTTFGDVPYGEALNYENPVPVYDDAETVYGDLLSRLDAALDALDPANTGFTTADLIYGGDVAKWIKFGNSLKLRMALLIADIDNTTAQTLAEEAAPNVIASAADNARLPYLSAPPNNNPVSANLNPLFSTRQDYVIAETFIETMKARNDPRLPQYFTTVDGEYIGGEYGFLNAYADFSHVSDKTMAPAFESLFMDYSEVEFLLAEALERGYAVGGTAEGHYNNAIRASIIYWGGTNAEADAYLAQANVAYTTAAGDYKEKIGIQTWIALNNRGLEAWSAWRKYDYPVLLPPSGPDVPPGLQVPVRLIYPINEQTLNGENRAKAATAIGGDVSTTKLFFDAN
jgi:hypothetical protein